jgi:cyclopropane-fatty-acyl-phospholipid synthase
MLEHVGVRQYETLFRRIKRLVAADGVALVHSIGRVAGPGTTNAWIRKYIFPGGYIPALSEVLPAVERTGLWVTDIEVLRLHYAYTLKEWRERFMANRQRAAELFDERFVRMWEYYLATSEISFRYLDNMNFQIQLTSDRNTLPLTRDYMVEAERRAPGPRLVERAAG